jgi:hypothetical protein
MKPVWAAGGAPPAAADAVPSPCKF